MIEPTTAYSGFTEYYFKARWLQTNCNLGNKPYTGPEADMNVHDKLMQENEIYDCVNRRYAGFSNVPQDLWFRAETPKFGKLGQSHQNLIAAYQTQQWDIVTFWYALLVHRITGSGASFNVDHGYRNSVVKHLGTCTNIDQMYDQIRSWSRRGVPMFTSIGNQPPAPKKGVTNVDFLLNEAEKLLHTLYWHVWERKGCLGHKDIVDFLNAYNIEQGHRRFNFAYSAFALDISVYWPEFVNELSHTYLGNNAKRCAKQLFTKTERISDELFFDAVMDQLAKDTGGLPKDLEDVMCDYIRYINGYEANQR